jgi:hypothetical protein
VIAAASPSNPVGLVQEMFAAGKVMAETDQQGAGNELIGALVAEVKARQKPEGKIEASDMAQLKTQALDGLRQLSALLAQKSPGEADAFKQWLLTIARRSAEAAREGGFLGIGGTPVSEAEQAALGEVAGALGIAA